MPHPGEVSAASTSRRSILETFGDESDDDIMDVDDEIEDALDDLQEEGEFTVVDPDAEAEQFFTAVNEQESDSDSEIEFVSMTGPGPAPWVPPTRASQTSSRSRSQATQSATSASQPIVHPPTQPISQPATNPTPPPTPPPSRPQPHQLQDLRWSDTDVQAILDSAGRHADASSVLLYNGEVKSLRGKTLLVVVIPAQGGMPWHVALCERTGKKARLICESNHDQKSMTDHALALFRAMGCRIDNFGAIALDRLGVPGPVWTSIAAIWLTRKGRRPLPQLTQLSIREEYVLRDINCLLRVGYWQGQCTVFRPVFRPTQPPPRVDAVQEPKETDSLLQPQQVTPSTTAGPTTRQQSIEPEIKPEYVNDDSESEASEQPGERTSYYGIDFSDEGVGKLLKGASETADKKCLIIYDNEKKFLQGAEQVILVFPPRNGLPWHLGVCHRPSQKTRLICPVREADPEVMLAHIKERFLAFPSLRCDMSDLAAVELPRRLGKVPVGGWAAIIAIWLSRGNSVDKLADSPRIRKKLMRKDLNLILEGNQWADKCFRTGYKERRRTRAVEKVKEEMKEEARRDHAKSSSRRRRRRGDSDRQRQRHATADSEERALNAEPCPRTPVFRTHAKQPITIHI